MLKLKRGFMNKSGGGGKGGGGREGGEAEGVKVLPLA